MLLTAIIVLVSLVTLPLIVRSLIIIIAWLTGGEKGVDLLYKPSKTIEQFRLKRKRLLYGILILFCVLILATFCWVLYEFMYEFNIALGIQGQFALFYGIIVLIVVTVSTIIVVRRAKRIRKRIPPPPPPGSSEKVLLEYRNLAYDESMRDTAQFYYKHTRLIVIIVISGLVLIPLILLIGILMEYLT
jgi:magnesium-transporting ATPase (P-type)